MGFKGLKPHIKSIRGIYFSFGKILAHALDLRVLAGLSKAAAPISGIRISDVAKVPEKSHLKRFMPAANARRFPQYNLACPRDRPKSGIMSV